MSTYDFNANNIMTPPEDDSLAQASVTLSAVSHHHSTSLSTHIENSVRQYFSELGSQEASDMYDLMLQQLEHPLLKVIFEQTKGNQTHMAEILGLNRGTLRKKLKRYDFIK